MTDGWAIAAVVAACGTWPFVAWQALETRRATNTATGALAASTATAIDAARARLDVEAPQIEVRVTGPAKHPQGPHRHGGAGGEWPSDQVWHFPRDEGLGKDLVVDLAVVITTRSDRPVHLSFAGDLY